MQTYYVFVDAVRRQTIAGVLSTVEVVRLHTCNLCKKKNRQPGIGMMRVAATAVAAAARADLSFGEALV